MYFSDLNKKAYKWKYFPPRISHGLFIQDVSKITNKRILIFNIKRPIKILEIFMNVKWDIKINSNISSDW